MHRVIRSLAICVLLQAISLLSSRGAAQRIDFAPLRNTPVHLPGSSLLFPSSGPCHPLSWGLCACCSGLLVCGGQQPRGERQGRDRDHSVQSAVSWTLSLLPPCPLLIVNSSVHCRWVEGRLAALVLAHHFKVCAHRWLMQMPALPPKPHAQRRSQLLVAIGFNQVLPAAGAEPRLPTLKWVAEACKRPALGMVQVRAVHRSPCLHIPQFQ